MSGGAAQRVGLALAGLVILALTFTLGMLVGRQWAQPAIQVVTAEPAKKGAVAARRGGIADVEAERAKGAQDRLTFYQTLTAPLGPSASQAKAAPIEKAKPEVRRAADAQAPPKAEARTAVRGEAGPTAEVAAAVPGPGAPGGGTAPTAPATPGAPATRGAEATQAATPAPGGEGAWTVQVGAFRSRSQADAIRKGLAAAGLPAEVSARTAEDGQSRHRVRVGTFRTRAEAERLAERLRSERSLATYVTTK